MPYNEFLAVREPVLNDEASVGEAEKIYDFRAAKPGEIVRIVTSDGVHELVRSESANEDSAVLKEWLHNGEPVDVTLFEPNKNGASFRLPGRAVVERGTEVRVNYVELPPKEANMSRSLGRVAGIADLLETEQEELEARVAVLQ